ncbi:MAG TPA: hypothetical protein VFO49_20055, partial [Nocardioides sp.]|nr:hypothetical protein [Nocardioides sp.]
SRGGECCRTDGASGVDVRADVGVTVPVLEGVTTGLWIGGAVLAVGAAALATAGLVRRRR